MFFTVEPMINAGRYDVKILEDGWTAVTRDRSLSAQFEHTIGVTADGCEIFTLSPAGYDRAALRRLAAGAPAEGTMADGRRQPKTPVPTTSAIGSACASASSTAAPTAFADYELLELLLCQAIPRRDVKPLAKALLDRFGSFAGVIAARARAPARSVGHGRCRRSPPQGGARRRGAACSARRATRPVHRLLGAAARLLPRQRWRTSRSSSSACCSSTARTR